MLVAGCASNPTQPTDVVVLGQPFDLRPGNLARLADGLEVRFEGVPADSRCPTNVQCVWAGDATVAISVISAAAKRVERELHTLLPSAETVINGYTIKLTTLTPSPRSDRPMDPAAYVATLTIRR